MKNDLEGRTLRLQRTLNAPRQLVWDAWTQPEHISAWWGPPNMATNIVAHDFTPGGKWHYSMALPDGSEFNAFGEFKEIQIPERIVTAASFPPMTTDVVLVITFEDLGAQTRITFETIHETAAYKQQQEQMGWLNGWGAHFDSLAAYVANV
ncbi:MAG: SRPBCC domain-containing protein, partial [Bacteroidota bacterium]